MLQSSFGSPRPRRFSILTACVVIWVRDTPRKACAHKCLRSDNNLHLQLLLSKLLLIMSAIAASQTASVTQCRCHFMHLPREIRNMVYAELWRQRPEFRVKCRNIYLQLSYDMDTECYSWAEARGLPTWLQTCKAFCHEGLEELHLKLHWKAGPYHVFGEWEHQYSTFEERSDTYLTNPATASELTIRELITIYSLRTNLQPEKLPNLASGQ